jgi:hypothetical protein
MNGSTGGTELFTGDVTVTIHVQAAKGGKKK